MCTWRYAIRLPLIRTAESGGCCCPNCRTQNLHAQTNVIGGVASRLSACKQGVVAHPRAQSSGVRCACDEEVQHPDTLSASAIAASSKCLYVCAKTCCLCDDVCLGRRGRGDRLPGASNHGDQLVARRVRPQSTIRFNLDRAGDWIKWINFSARNA